MKNMHGFTIVVNADKSDWGKQWGMAPEDAPRCWCCDCTIRRLTPVAGDVMPQSAEIKSGNSDAAQRA